MRMFEEDVRHLSFTGVEEEEEEEENPSFQPSDPQAVFQDENPGSSEPDGKSGAEEPQNPPEKPEGEDDKELLEYARKVRAYEKEHNVNFDQLVPEFTRRSQRLAELEKSGGEPEKPDFREKLHQPSEEELALQNKLRAQGFLTREDIETRERVQEEARQLDESLKSYVEKYPFVDPVKVLEKMEQFAPEAITEDTLKAAVMAVHAQDFENHWQEQALAKKTPNATLSRGTPGGNLPNQDQQPKAKTWDDVERSALDRLEAGEAQDRP